MKKFLQEKIVQPFLVQLKSGASVENLALSASAGMALGVVPVLWISTILGIVLAAIFRLNQIVLQVANYAIQILQYIMIPVYLNWGDRLFGVTPFSLTPHELKEQIGILGGKGFMIKFSSSIWHGFVMWLITVPVIMGLSYLVFLPLFKKLRARYAHQ